MRAGAEDAGAANPWAELCTKAQAYAMRCPSVATFSVTTCTSHVECKDSVFAPEGLAALGKCLEAPDCRGCDLQAFGQGAPPTTQMSQLTSMLAAHSTQCQQGPDGVSRALPLPLLLPTAVAPVSYCARSTCADTPGCLGSTVADVSSKIRACRSNLALSSPEELAIASAPPVALPDPPSAGDAGIALSGAVDLTTNGGPADPLVGQPAPEVSGVSADKKPAARLRPLRGKVVIVHFLAGWNPMSETTTKGYGAMVSRDVAVIGVGVDDSVDDLRAFAKKTQPRFPLVWDGNKGTTARDYKPGVYPSTYVVDKKGVIRFVEHGHYDTTISRVQAVVNKLR
jgi:peroxiredoxin